MKQLVKEDQGFKEEYLANKESILVLSMTIIAVSAIVITLIIMLA